MTGTDIKKLKRAAAMRSRFRLSAAAMVAPEREMPGNNAKACPNPIQVASSPLNASNGR